MELSIKTRKEVTRVLVQRYQKAGKKEKTGILNEFCQTCGYKRSYAATLLRNWKNPNKRKKNAVKSKRTGCPSIYGKDIQAILIELWSSFVFLRGKFI